MSQAIATGRSRGFVLTWGKNRFYVDTMLLLAGGMAACL